MVLMMVMMMIVMMMIVLMMIVLMMIVAMMILTQPTGARCGGRPHGALPWERRQALRPHTDAYCKFSHRSWSEPLKCQEMPRDRLYALTRQFRSNECTHVQ